MNMRNDRSGRYKLSMVRMFQEELTNLRMKEPRELPTGKPIGLHKQGKTPMSKIVRYENRDNQQ